MASLRLILSIVLLHVVLSHCASTVEFFSDKNCKGSIGKLNGTTDGVCKSAIADNGSVRVISLDPGCAASIYTDPFCSNDATIANLNTCMSGGLIVGSFSIDCESTNPTSKAFTQAAKPTSTKSKGFDTSATKSSSSSTASSSATDEPAIAAASKSAEASTTPTSSSSSSEQDNDGTTITPGAIAGIVIGCVVLVALLPIAYFLRRHLKNKALAKAGGSPRNDPGPNELYGNETAELAQDYPRSPPPVVQASPYAMKSSQMTRDGYTRRAEADGNPYSPDGQAPPEYWAQEKDLPAVPVTIQQPGQYAELDDSSGSIGRNSPNNLHGSPQLGQTSPSFVSPITGRTENPAMGRPF